MKIYIVEYRVNSAEDTVREVSCTIEDLFSLTHAFDTSDYVVEYKIGAAGVYFDKHPLGCQCDKLVTKFNW
jgi:hypothetical protein